MKTLRAKLRKRGGGRGRAQGTREEQARGGDDAAGGAQDHRRQEGLLEHQGGTGNLSGKGLRKIVTVQCQC